MDEFTDVRHVNLKCLGGWGVLGRYSNYALYSWIYRFVISSNFKIRHKRSIACIEQFCGIDLNLRKAF